MAVIEEARRGVYAAIGASERAASAARELWAYPRQSFDRVLHIYQECADRGEQILTRTGKEARQQGNRLAREARRVPGVAPVEGEVTGGLSTTDEKLPLPHYDSLNAAEIVGRLPVLSQRELHQVEGYERRHHGRRTVLAKIEDLRGAEPWPGYDEMNVEEIVQRLRGTSGEERAAVLAHERRHKNRDTVVQAATRSPG